MEVAYTIDPSVYAVQIYESRTEGVFACSAPVGLGSVMSGAINNGVTFGYITVYNSCQHSSLGYGFVLYRAGTGAVVDFLSTDISFVAPAGQPAAGLQSVMIGGTPLVGTSLQRTGEGCSSSDFVWQTSSLSLGAKNLGQVVLCVELALPTSVPSNPPSSSTVPPNIFTNEIHYFNNGVDQREFVELAYQTGQDVSQVYLQLYIGTDGQGATGQMYGERLFVGTHGMLGSVGASGDLSLVYFDIDGLRHSAGGDGMALVDGRSGVVIEFISYDGQFVATQGPANGLESVDIGVSELMDGGVGLSLQLGGVGCVRSGFVWQTVQTATKGELNYGQAGTCASNAPSSSPSMTPSLVASSAPSLLPSSAPSVVVVSSVPICEAQYGR